MAEFKLERFKYNWRGAWTTSAAYKRDDVVRVNGKSYVCIITHVASATFAADLTAILPGSVPPQPQPKWVVMTNGQSFQGDWTTAVAYNLGDIINYNGSLWNCIDSHTSDNFATQFDKWELFAQSQGFVSEWASATTYAPGAIVKYNGIAYKCVSAHISEATLEAALGGDDSSGAWVVFHEGQEVRDSFSSGVEYRLNDLVKDGGSIYRCTETHTSGQKIDITKFVIEVFGTQYEGTWNAAINYNIGDVVRHLGFMYYAINDNNSSVPYSDNQSENWILLSRNYSFVGTWSPSTVTVNSTTGLLKGMVVSIPTGVGQFAENTKITSIINSSQFTISKKPIIALGGASVTGTINNQSVTATVATSNATAYRTGDIVLRGGYLYLALRDISGSFDDGSTLDYIDPTIWELVVPGKSFKGTWNANNLYSIGSVVVFKGSAYTCNFEHESDFRNFPGDNSNGIEYWDILIEAGQPAALEAKGDILTFGPNRQIDSAGDTTQDGSTVFDDSSLGDTRLAIGTTDQILSVSPDLETYWRDIVEDADVVFVTSNGIDGENTGTYESPFKTIRYAAEYVEDTYAALTPVLIKVSTGKYNEIGPIIVPAGCAINGDELRSTTVLASPAITDYQNDYAYVVDYLTHFTSIVQDIILGNAISPQTGNTETQIISQDLIVIDELTGDQRIEPSTYPVSNLDAAEQIANLVTDFKNFIEFNILSGSNNPTVSGSNIVNANQTITNAGLGLKLNRKFLQQELLSYLENQYPAITFGQIRVTNDVRSLLRGIIRDVTYSGNYSTLVAAKRYANAVNGSQTTNLFLMRDTTGLRDMTTGGLKGVLNPPGVFELYQKPTGGSLVSLDPGWGPTDERTWIKSRSPYIQGVTNTGTGCTGMKVDGALHAGGNKSMTANDFTQVLSDGIGAWVTNNARAELVSVFTYYCQIGYFAEDGGIIRAANGNNSYGKYGSIADGIDDTEVPQVVAAFNRNNQATVAEAFAGGEADELLVFEYSTTGQEYTTATATVTGAGANANVEYTDFRDGGVFEGRLITSDGSSAAGGTGYLRIQGNAQEIADASVTIKLSANDVTQFESEILGLRIIVTDGLGVGQYGYIDGFTFASKEVTVRKDSDDTAGWDHLIPGTPLVATFDLTTRYRIEPRVTVPAPPYLATSSSLFTNRSYVDMAFGNITDSYTGVTGGGNVIWRDDDQLRVTVNSVISDIAIQFNADFSANPNVPFNIKGRTSGATATVTAISANTDTLIEVDVESGGNGFQVDEEIDLVLTSGTGDTFDGAAINAVFSVVRTGTTYSVSTTNSGAGYTAGDKITILGTALGGITPANDLTITVGTVSDDSTSSILSLTSSGIGRVGRFVSLTNAEKARWSNNGSEWTEVALPFVGTMTSLTAGNNRFIATASGESKVASSLNGITWSEVALPLTAAWADSVHGNGKFVLVATDTNAVASSTDGVTWVTGNIPDDVPGGATSTISTWTSVTYGKGKYVAISSSDGATASSINGTTWTRHDEAISFLPAYIAYGNNRFVAVAAVDGESAYSFDGITWYTNSDTLSDISSVSFGPKNVKYANGVFFVVGTVSGAATTVAFTSEDGVAWTQRALPADGLWSALTFGNTKWFIKASAASTNAVAAVSVGAKALLRAEVSVGSISELRVINPGSGYSRDTVPLITITDPNLITEVATECRIGNKVLSQPDFINRGAGYRRTTSTITIIGDGFADIIPVGNKLTISGVTTIPGPGVQIKIAGVFDPTALEPDILAVFVGVTVKDLGDDGTGNETKLIEFQISPRIDVEDVVLHGTQITLQERYSQCRISGHDFLDIGTGNFTQTNYPAVYAGGAFFSAAPENEVYENNSGRVYYVSTDQDGNFRTGELFSVQQATGIVTISAEFFDLDGLSELALGGVRLGGSGTVVSEFSTDGTFSADSNNVIPTQRAIATFLQNRLSVGGSELEVNKLQAGRVLLGGTPENEINTITGQYLIIPSDVVFDGTFTSDDGEGTVTTNQTGISGTIVSQIMMLRTLDDSMQ